MLGKKEVPDEEAKMTAKSNEWGATKEIQQIEEDNVIKRLSIR
ncbi:hypothetical protein [Desulforamulus ruminis]|uniref:Uncharacterized protein n=1 Tax=Desulforamulus ruminis (strain ATCC 23193 / DSM 2154 / NCIMB 8452 / DL) TaxID=696281 RepID=F6DKR5_DESRL|nr:hypothetical protein [Desulforamulus ruminis]AEG60440.1 hypothetical protein Desru_2191 [Desulforamulus ruminis DSM 2154]